MSSGAAPQAAIDDPSAKLRASVYWLLIAVALGAFAGRVLAVNSVDRLALERQLIREGRPNWRLQRPFLSANDRSRWCTVRSLVEQGTYAIDDIVAQPGWDTVDMVKHNGHLYSSKPPLMATLMAIPYWLVYRISGYSLASHPFEIGRAMLLLINGGALLLYLTTLARIVERYARSDWARLFLVTAACFGTFLTTFAVVINNHLIGALGAVLSASGAVRIVYQQDRRWSVYGLTGLAAGLAVVGDLPALAWAGVLGLWLLAVDWRRAVVGYGAGLAVVAVAFFATTWAAYGSLIPAYGHRGEGNNWYEYTYMQKGKLHQSYWMNRTGIDRGEASPATYALHVLVGHHGVFSLTPLWLLALVGWAIVAARRDQPLRGMIVLIALVSLVCIAFYLTRPLIDRNYGGMTSGFRWVFWLAPLWLISTLPCADYLATRRWGRATAAVLLALSVLSASYPTWNPWTHPWLWNFMAQLGWIQGA